LVHSGLLVLEEPQDDLAAETLDAKSRDSRQLSGAFHAMNGFGAHPQEVGHFMGRQDGREIKIRF
jgi:hypothetical protein